MSVLRIFWRSIWIAWRSIRQRALSSSLTGLSMALGVALVVAVLVVSGVVESSFSRNAQGYHLIVGAKGGALQLVLNTVFHLSRPIENVPYGFYEEFTDGRYASMVEAAVPYCLGDNYEGFRVVGTVPELFEAFEYAPGMRYEFAEGENFHDEDFFDAVVGSYVARQTGLKVGDHFQPTHGISTEEGEGHKHDAFRVVGVLEPTGTANDRALFVNMEGFYLLDQHAKPVDEDAEPTSSHRHDEDADDGHEHDEDADAHAHDDDADEKHQHDEHGEEPSDEDENAGGHESGTEATHGDVHGHDGEHDEEHGHDTESESHAHHEETERGHAHADEGPRHADSGGHEHADGDDHQHDEGDRHEHTPLPKNQREVTAVLLLLKNDLFSQEMYRNINEGEVGQAVFPAREVTNLFEGIVGPIRTVLLALAVLIVVVAAIGVMVSIYNTMSERRREIAVLRALGAGRGTVLFVVLAESVLLALLGGVAGIVIGHGLIAALNPVIVARAGVPVAFLQFDLNELVLIPSLIALAALAGFVPGMAAYRTDVAKALTANP